MKKKSAVALFLLGILFLTSGFLIRQNSLNQGPIIKKNSLKDVSLKSSEEKTPEITEASQISNELIVRVIDGDTVVSNTGNTIRYLGINAPEKGQPFSTESTEKNKNLVLGKSINLEYDLQVKDKYGRTLAYVFIGNKFINLEMVKSGLAVSETIQPNVKYQDQILGAQKTSRDSCLGIWSGLCLDLSKNESCVRIAFINADPPGNDNEYKNNEWIEFKNTCSASVSMQNWLVKDNSASNKYQFKNFLLNSNQTVKLHSGCGQDSLTDLYWKCPEQKYAVWNNSGGDHAFLYNEKGEMISDYQY